MQPPVAAPGRLQRHGACLWPGSGGSPPGSSPGGMGRVLSRGSLPGVRAGEDRDFGRVRSGQVKRGRDRAFRAPSPHPHATGARFPEELSPFPARRKPAQHVTGRNKNKPPRSRRAGAAPPGTGPAAAAPEPPGAPAPGPPVPPARSHPLRPRSGPRPGGACLGFGELPERLSGGRGRTCRSAARPRCPVPGGPRADVGRGRGQH